MLATLCASAMMGVGGTIGTDIAAKSAPDGYTLLLVAAATYTVNANIYSKLPYDPCKDLFPLTIIVGRLHQELVRAVNSPEVKARLEAEGAEIIANSPDEARASVRADLEKWAEVARKTGVYIGWLGDDDDVNRNALIAGIANSKG